MNKNWSQLGVAFCKYVLGPVLALVVGMWVGNKNHEQSAKGYEVLAKSYNEQVLAKLLELDSRLDQIEKRPTPSSQPVLISIPEPVRAGLRPLAAASKAPRTIFSATVSAPPPPAPPPSRPRAQALQRLPERLDTLR